MNNDWLFKNFMNNMEYSDYTLISGISGEVSDIVALWELSVRATHTFLNESDIEALRPLVREGVQRIEQLYCRVRKSGQLEAFMGVEGDKLEMLFVHPASRGKGAGRQLVEYAVKELGVRFVDVNEQNPQAAGFYEHLGFCCEGRSEKDGQGNTFPVLHLKLKE